ncbi:MAG TPA: CpsB/CapC family capsule biosynthesis tyrosine phosphatase [Gemmatimonadaceae bacterium]|nr:CpsB/CapC family capsule biosynthesis tyrosine phosphatase [Gemmatimonadaceae bacterium]
MLDFHNHLMPGVDDGAEDIHESREGLTVLRNQGVDTVITTPHLRGSLTLQRAELSRAFNAMDASWAELAQLGTADFSSIRLERGVELMLDVPRPDLSDERLRLAGTSFVLVEFPFMSLPPNSTMAIREMSQNGWTPIIAHPERYASMASNLELIEDWRIVGAAIQVNAGSLGGHYGPSPRRIAWELIESGLADYLCSDYHSRGRCPVAEAARLLKAAGGSEQHELLTSINPSRILADEQPLAVPPLETRQGSFWKKLIPWQ